jgi:fatty-acyl-CoA synthase
VVSKLLPRHDALPGEELVKVKLKQGRGVWGVDLKIVDDDGQPQPWDGKAYGHLRVRGPWIASGYFKGEGGSPVDEEGFFTTGDVATIDADGFLQLVDRSDRCCWWCRAQARASAASPCSNSCPRASPNGGCPTMCSRWPSCRIRRRGNCSRPSSVSSTGITP